MTGTGTTHRIPPKTFCRNCGVTRRAWQPDALCGSCTKATYPRATGEESLREFRKRLKGE